ncbi:MAG: hypothetical protein HYZ36_08460 [Pedosphaera parvula]|nr:hypothetical protein [Pedosphaera parvula]
MTRNRKRQSAAIRLGPAVLALVLCLFFGAAGVGYVWQKNQIFALGKQIKEREMKLEELRRQNKQRADHLAHLRSPGFLDARVKELNLGLAPARPEQILRLTELPYVTIAEEPEKRMASRGAGETAIP